MFNVVCMNDNQLFSFNASSPFEAMKSMINQLGVTLNGKGGKVSMYGTNKMIALRYDGKIYKTQLA